jgi:mitogen-activated protein kinase 1/3
MSLSHHQIELILNVIGTPTSDEFYAITSNRSKDYMRSLPFRKRRTFESLYPTASPMAIDFLQRTLTCAFILHLDLGPLHFLF